MPSPKNSRHAFRSKLIHVGGPVRRAFVTTATALTVAIGGVVLLAPELLTTGESLRALHTLSTTFSSQSSRKPPVLYTDPTRWPDRGDPDRFVAHTEDLALYVKSLPPVVQRKVSVTKELQEDRRLRVTTLSKEAVDSGYAHDFRATMALLPEAYHQKTILVWDGRPAETTTFPVITPSRVKPDPNAFVTPLGHTQSFDRAREVGTLDHTAFGDKDVKVYWRGAPASTHTASSHIGHMRGAVSNEQSSMPEHMKALLEKWGRGWDRRVDVGLSASAFKGGYPWRRYVKTDLPLEKALEAKYLLYVEDADSHEPELAWMLASNSVVFMPQPNKETCFMEGRLKPWEHYVPVREDYANLWDRVLLCEAHQDKCEAITKRAQAFVKQFESPQKIYELGAERLRVYMDNTEVEVTE